MTFVVILAFCMRIYTLMYVKYFIFNTLLRTDIFVKSGNGVVWLNIACCRYVLARASNNNKDFW